jgi:hypothetical protein
MLNYAYLLLAGIPVSAVHFYLVWHHSEDRRYSISEHAVLTHKSHLLYFAAHLNCEIFYTLFSYQLFIVSHHAPFLFYLNLAFAVLDFVQAALPSRGNTEKIHIATAYVSWCSYLLAGVLAFFSLHVEYPYRIAAMFLLVPILGMFFYMHINHRKLYPYQLAVVPLFVIYMLLVSLGAD